MPITSYKIHLVTLDTLVSETSQVGFVFLFFIDHSFLYSLCGSLFLVPLIKTIHL